MYISNSAVHAHMQIGQTSSGGERRGFTLIELLTVIAIIAVLSAVLIPAVGGMLNRARKTTAANNLRQIAIAYANYTSQEGSQQRTIVASNAHEFALFLAKEAGLNDPGIFVLSDDPLVQAHNQPLPVAVAYPAEDGSGWALDTAFADFPISFAFVSGLSPSSPPSTTPIAWTRGLQNDGTWKALTNESPAVYGAEGGHIIFLDGHVEYFRDLKGADGAGVLQHFETRRPTANILEAISPNATVLESD